MKSENERSILNERLAENTQVLSPGETIRRCRSLNELPGHHRVTVLRRGDTERTRARLEAVAAGMVELKHLREKHQQLMEEALCETSRKQISQRLEVEERPKRRHQNLEKSNSTVNREFPSHGVDGKKSRQRVEHPSDLQSKEELRRQNKAQYYSKNRDDLSRPNMIPREGARIQDDSNRRHQKSLDSQGSTRRKPQEDSKRNARQERSPGQRPCRDSNDKRQQNWNHQVHQRAHDSNLPDERQGANHQAVDRKHNVMHRENVDPGVNRSEVYIITDQRMQNQVPTSVSVSRTGEVKEQAYYGLPSHHSTPHNVHLVADPKSSQHRTYSSTKINHGATYGEGSDRAAWIDNSHVITYSGSSARLTNQNSQRFENRAGNSAKLWKDEADFATPPHAYNAYNDKELRHCLVLTQSDQRFSRGRTQSVHENFYYFPIRSDSGNKSSPNSETTENYKNNQHLQTNARNANFRPQINFQSVHNNTNKGKPISSVESFKMASTQQSKSISWDELLVSVGLGKNTTSNDCAKTDQTYCYASKVQDSQMNITDTRERHIGSKGDENLDSYGEEKTIVSQKPYRSQSFSGVKPNVYHSNTAQYSDMSKRQKIDDSLPQNNSVIINSISRHPSLSTVSSKIVNPLHEVDIRSMSKPGPVHAVTLQYAGLTTRHMSLGSIPSASGLAPSASQESFPTKERFSETNSLNPSNKCQSVSKQGKQFDSHTSRNHPGVGIDVDYNDDIKEKITTPLETHLANVDNGRLNASTTNEDAMPAYSPTAFNRPRSSTSLPSPKYSSINTITEDSEEVFEYPVVPNISSDKPRTLSGTRDKSNLANEDPVSTRGQSMTKTILTRKKSHDSSGAPNTIESQGLLLQKERHVIQNSPGIETPLSTSSHPVTELLPSKVSDVILVVDEAYITCDSASVNLHKMTTGKTSADNSSVSSGSISNVSANSDTLVCVQNNFQRSQRNKNAHTNNDSKTHNSNNDPESRNLVSNDSKTHNCKDPESRNLVSDNLSVETVEMDANPVRTIPPDNEATIELPTAQCHQNLNKTDNSGLNRDVDDKIDSKDTGISGDLISGEKSNVGQTQQPDDKQMSPKKQQPFKQTAL